MRPRDARVVDFWPQMQHLQQESTLEHGLELGTAQALEKAEAGQDISR